MDAVSAPGPLDSPERVEILDEYEILDTPPERRFDHFTLLAQRLLGAPVALLSIVEAHRQFFKSGFGLGEPFGSQREAPTSISLCRYVVEYSRPLIVGDARRTPEFCDHVAVREHSVRAYLGMPLRTYDGCILGAFCVNDSEPREWTEADIEVMETLTAGVMAELENRRHMARLRQTLERRTDQLKSARASLHQLGVIVEHSSDAIIALSPEGRVLTWSGAAETLYGYNAGEMIGQSITRVIPAERRASYLGFLEYIRTGNRIPAFESERLRRDGSRVAIEETLFPSLDAQGQVAAISSLARDITALRHVEGAYQAAERRYRTLCEHASVGIWQVNAAEETVYMNPAMCALLEIDNEHELLRSDVRLNFFSPESAAQMARQQRRPDRATNYEAEIIGRRGRRRHVLAAHAPLFGAHGDLEGQIRLYFDVTPQVNARKSLQTNEERFRSVFESATDAIIICDSAGRILLWNPGATRMFGYAGDAAFGQSLAFLAPDAAGPLATALNALESDTLPDARAALLLPLKHESGADVMAELVLTAWDSHGVRHISAIIRDVSERMHFEAQLRDAQKMEAVGRMAAGIAHDFNNFNTIIRGCLDLARAELTAESPLHEYLDEAHTTTDRSVQLTQQIMDLCREANRAPAESLDLEVAVREGWPAFQTLLGPAIALEFVPPESSVAVAIDRSDLFRVLTNLLANARDALQGSGRVELAIQTRRGVIPHAGSGLSMERDLVFITVADSGPGIDPAVQARIFEPFFTTKAPEAGTGLGLATVYRIVQNAGGNISVASEPGAGATFTIRLPAARTEPE